MRKTSTPYARMPVHGLVRRAEGIGAFFATLVQFRYPKGVWNSFPRSYRSRSAAPKCRRQIFQSSPRIQEERLGFINETERSGFSRAAHITECCGLPSVGLRSAAGPAGLDQERRVGKRF